MYNAVGLQTARGSGSNCYIQSNKFSVRPETGEVVSDNKGFDSSHDGTAGFTRKPNKDILDHDRKRKIELKLVTLEERLKDEGYPDAEIAEKVEDARKTPQAASNCDDSGNSQLKKKNSW